MHMSVTQQQFQSGPQSRGQAVESQGESLRRFSGVDWRGTGCAPGCEGLSVLLGGGSVRRPDPSAQGPPRQHPWPPQGPAETPREPPGSRARICFLPFRHSAGQAVGGALWGEYIQGVLKTLVVRMC